MKTSASLKLPLLMVTGVALLALPNFVDNYVAFAISALHTCQAGALSAYVVGFLDPQEFSVFLSIQFITIIIVGGLASLLGAGFLIILPELLGGLDVWQALVYGVIMVLTILFMPSGLSGSIRRLSLVRHRRLAYDPPDV